MDATNGKRTLQPTTDQIATVAKKSSKEKKTKTKTKNKRKRRKLAPEDHVLVLLDIHLLNEKGGDEYISVCKNPEKDKRSSSLPCLALPCNAPLLES